MRCLRNVVFLALSALVFFGGCASTPMLVSEWSNPAYQSPSFKRIAVSCLDGHASIRRNCEDEFVLQLRAAGIDALPSYRSLPDDAKLDESKVKQLAKDAGADGALIDDEDLASAKQALKRHYYPGTRDWQEMVLFRSRQIIRQALAGLAGEG